MGNEFKAASGRTVNVAADGSVMFGPALGYLSREAAFDAEEYFRAKQDEDLGRWRVPIDPQYVVYPQRDPDWVVVMDEATGNGSIPIKRDRALRCGSAFQVAAHQYFEAHPKREPWHEAQTGEFWSITHTGQQETCRVDDVNGVLRFVGVDGIGLSVSMPVTHHSITAGRRMVAEVAA